MTCSQVRVTFTRYSSVWFFVNGLHIKSTGSHEELSYGPLTKIGCKVQGCVSVIIRVKEVALHLGGKVLSNSKMAFHGTQVKGISPSLQWMIGQAHNRSWCTCRVSDTHVTVNKDGIFPVLNMQIPVFAFLREVMSPFNVKDARKRPHWWVSMLLCCKSTNELWYWNCLLFRSGALYI